MKVSKKLYKEAGIKEIARKAKSNQLAKCLNINLRIESKKAILSISEYISDEKNLKIAPIYSSLKDKCIAFCPKLPFKILSLCSIKAMHIISSDSKITNKWSVIPEIMTLPSFLKDIVQLIEE